MALVPRPSPPYRPAPRGACEALACGTAGRNSCCVEDDAIVRVPPPAPSASAAPPEQERSEGCPSDRLGLSWKAQRGGGMTLPWRVVVSTWDPRLAKKMQGLFRAAIRGPQLCMNYYGSTMWQASASPFQLLTSWFESRCYLPTVTIGIEPQRCQRSSLVATGLAHQEQACSVDHFLTRCLHVRGMRCGVCG